MNMAVNTALAFCAAILLSSAFFALGKYSVKEQCEKLQSFYVDSKIYECKVK